MLFQQRLILQCLARGAGDRRGNNPARVLRKAVGPVKSAHAARHDFRGRFHRSAFAKSQDQRQQTVVGHLLALADRVAGDLFETRVGDKRASDLFLADDRRAFTVELQHVAVFDQDDVLFGIAQVILDEFFVPKKHSVFAVNRYHEFRAHGFGHDANVFLRSMAADVDQAPFLFNDVRAAFVDESDHPGNDALVPGNDARRQDDGIALFDRHPFVTLAGHL